MISENYCCDEYKCFPQPRDQVDGLACRICGFYSYCRCQCETYKQRIVTLSFFEEKKHYIHYFRTMYLKAGNNMTIKCWSKIDISLYKTICQKFATSTKLLMDWREKQTECKIFDSRHNVGGAEIMDKVDRILCDKSLTVGEACEKILQLN